MLLFELKHCLDSLNFTPAINKENKDDTETLMELIEAIERHGEIELFYEY
jgi:hypothetical protein